MNSQEKNTIPNQDQSIRPYTGPEINAQILGDEHCNAAYTYFAAIAFPQQD